MQIRSINEITAEVIAGACKRREQFSSSTRSSSRSLEPITYTSVCLKIFVLTVFCRRGVIPDIHGLLRDDWRNIS